MAPIPDPSKKPLVSPLPGVCQSPALTMTVKTNQSEEARNEVRQNLPMRRSSVSCEGHIVSLGSEETDHGHETQCRTSDLFKKTQLVTGSNSVKSIQNMMQAGLLTLKWAFVTSDLEEEGRDEKLKGRFPWGAEKKRFVYAVENDDDSSSSSSESNLFDHRFENDKNTTKTSQSEVKAKNPGKWFSFHEH